MYTPLIVGLHVGQVQAVLYALADLRDLSNSDCSGRTAGWVHRQPNLPYNVHFVYDASAR